VAKTPQKPVDNRPKLVHNIDMMYKKAPKTPVLFKSNKAKKA
jgi:hypothetical protein